MHSHKNFSTLIIKRADLRKACVSEIEKQKYKGKGKFVYETNSNVEPCF
tara:strand:- start:487 stop:633 length:147 start_codon:yes stop_codon:yes gene_type:complete